MVNTRKTLERYLQKYRFQKVKKYLVGDVLDFGGNDGELKQFVTGHYTIVNYDYAPMRNKRFDTIVLLAVVEHIEILDVYQIFKNFKTYLKNSGTIFLTTPTPRSKPILETLAFLNILDKKNIDEHKHYWNRDELIKLAQETGYKVVNYKKFQLGFNQYLVLKHWTV